MNEKDNQSLRSLIESLLKTGKPIWLKVAYELSKPRRSKVEVNLDKLEKYANDKKTVLVPGKVLGTGAISKKVTVAAFSFSQTAQKLINDKGGKAMSIRTLHESNPEGKDVIIIK